MRYQALSGKAPEDKYREGPMKQVRQFRWDSIKREMEFRKGNAIDIQSRFRKRDPVQN
jgi:hypothetical protein